MIFPGSEKPTLNVTISESVTVDISIQPTSGPASVVGSDVSTAFTIYTIPGSRASAFTSVIRPINHLKVLEYSRRDPKQLRLESTTGYYH